MIFIRCIPIGGNFSRNLIHFRQNDTPTMITTTATMKTTTKTCLPFKCFWWIRFWTQKKMFISNFGAYVKQSQKEIRKKKNAIQCWLLCYYGVHVRVRVCMQKIMFTGIEISSFSTWPGCHKCHIQGFILTPNLYHLLVPGSLVLLALCASGVL